MNKPITEPRKIWGRKRFERMHSTSLWQADFKLCEDDYWMISFQNDHLRFITGSNTGESRNVTAFDAIMNILDHGAFPVAVQAGDKYTLAWLPEWTSIADINCDGTVGIYDTVTVAVNFGQTY